MILGGLVEGQCLICGHVEKLKLGIWEIWFPPKNSQHRHTKRDFLSPSGKKTPSKLRLVGDELPLLKRFYLTTYTLLIYIVNMIKTIPAIKNEIALQQFAMT